LGFDEKREKETLVIDKSPLKAHIQIDSLLVPLSEETIEVQVQVKQES